MATPAASKPQSSVKAAQALAKQKALEKKAKSYKLDLSELSIFTSQLASLLQAGLPLVSCLEALQDQTEDQVFRIVIRDVRNDISTGTSFSSAVKKFPKAFPNLFISMVEAGEASGGLAEILGKVAGYFESTVKLTKKVKSAMTYPVIVLCIALSIAVGMIIFIDYYQQVAVNSASSGSVSFATNSHLHSFSDTCRDVNFNYLFFLYDPFSVTGRTFFCNSLTLATAGGTH